MKQHTFVPLFLCVLSLFLVSFKTGDPEGSSPLDKMNWSEKNYRVLNQMIKDYGKGGKYYDENRKPYAVLDWDQTCAHFDVEEALMRYQMFHLRYKLTKEAFAGLLLNNINGVTHLSDAFQHVLLADINEDLINDYSFLYDQFIGPEGGMTLQEVQKTPQYSDFVAKIPFLYSGYSATTGIGDDYGYPWLLYLFAGQTIDEVKTMAHEAISFELSNQIARQTLQSPAGFPTKAGRISYSYKSGLRVFPEMQDLISTFQRYGIDVFIVSASYKPVVEAFSGIDCFGYNIPADHVIGMELHVDKDGTIISEYKPGWVRTFRQGKVEAIDRVIKKGLGRNWDPLFSAGDSDGDYEMLSGFPGMKMSLIWNRSKGGDIGKLYLQAIKQADSDFPRYILQGRNEKTGAVIPGTESILL